MLEKNILNSLSMSLVANPKDYMRSLRCNLYTYLNNKDITLQEVSDLADIQLSTLKSLLYGSSKDCNLATVIKLAKVFGISVDELVGCGTISPQTCDSLQMLRAMPPSYTNFIRWEIQFHYKMVNTQLVNCKSIEIMKPYINRYGNMALSNDMDIIDISEIDSNIIPKIFMGIKLPSNLYAPIYFEGDCLLLANDRPPLDNENVVICYGENIWILKYKSPDMINHTEGYYCSIRDNCKRANLNEIQFIFGYIAYVKRL